jgi:hypothetical protein
METGCSLPRSQEPTTDPCPELDESNSYSPTIFTVGFVVCYLKTFQLLRSANDEWMSTDNWRGKRKYPLTNLFQCHLAHHKWHVLVWDQTRTSGLRGRWLIAWNLCKIYFNNILISITALSKWSRSFRTSNRVLVYVSSNESCNPHCSNT